MSINVDATTGILGLNGYCGIRELEEAYNASPDPELSVLKRLFAAIRSASRRGNVKFTHRPVGRVRYEENGATLETCTRIRVQIDSDGGHWSARKYKMVAMLDISVDEYGVTWWGPLSGAAKVVGASGDQTIFYGTVVAHTIGSLFFRTGLAKRFIIAAATTEETTDPDWHTHARAQLGELVGYGNDDLSGQVATLIRIAAASQERILATVKALTLYGVMDTVQAERLIQACPDDWADAMRAMLTPQASQDISSWVLDEILGLVG
jgi:hypothetical protein